MNPEKLYPRPEKPKRGIINIFFEPGGVLTDGSRMQGATIALCNDGTLWAHYSSPDKPWYPYPPIPQDEPREIKTDTNFSIEQIEEMQKRINEEGEDV